MSKLNNSSQKNSVEETMEALNQKESIATTDDEKGDSGKSDTQQDSSTSIVITPDDNSSVAGKEKKNKQAKLHFLLKNLKLIRNNDIDKPKQPLGKKRKVTISDGQTGLQTNESTHILSETSEARQRRVRFEI